MRFLMIPVSALCFLLSLPASAAEEETSPSSAETFPDAAHSPANPKVAAPQPEVVVPAAREASYAGEVLVADGISAGVMLASIFLPSTGGVVTLGGLGGYVFASPIVHLAHGSPWRALGSLGLRTVLPAGLGVGGAYAGFALSTARCSGLQCLGGIVVGALLGVTGLVFGMASASAVDAGFLARERVPVKALPVNVSPYVTPTAAGTDVGLQASGTF